MSKIVIELPENRSGVGTLCLHDAQGVKITGPFKACGRADRKTATSEGNPSGDRLRPYGDTPLGSFAIIDFVKTGDGSQLDVANFGPHGAIRLRPVDGEAVRPEGVRRTGFMVHGGDLTTKGRLRPTTGCIRLSNVDMKALMEAIALLSISDGPPTSCVVVQSLNPVTERVGSDEGYAENDPPVGMENEWHLELRKTREGKPLGSLISAVAVSTSFTGPGQGHDRDGHDREVHDREVHDREANREPAGHDRDANHDRDSHDRGI